MYLGLPILAFSNGYNENTTFFKAKYFKDADELCNMVKSITKEELDGMRPVMKELAEAHYRWEGIAKEYEKLFEQIVNK